jgi:hypothetical protein
MSDVLDLTERQLIDRANKAKALLENSELAAAFSSVRIALLQRIEECPVRDRDGVHELKLQLKLLNDVKANLQSVVNTGKVIESRITMLERAKKGVVNAFRR